MLFTYLSTHLVNYTSRKMAILQLVRVTYFLLQATFATKILIVVLNKLHSH